MDDYMWKQPRTGNMKDQEENFAKAYKIYQARKESSKKKKQSKYDFSEVYSEILIFG
jgi:hypothetical protein